MDACDDCESNHVHANAVEWHPAVAHLARAARADRIPVNGTFTRNACCSYRLQIPSDDASGRTKNRFSQVFTVASASKWVNSMIAASMECPLSLPRSRGVMAE